jgi:hypothetical protein
MVLGLVRGVQFRLALDVLVEVAHGNFYGWGGGGGDFSDVGDSGGADVGVGDARDVLVDGGRGTAGSGTKFGCGREVGDGAGEGFEWGDEFAGEMNGRQGSRENRKA